MIEGRSVQEISFSEAGRGVYRYVRDYYILRTDPPYIDIYVNVTDPYGNVGKALKKLRTLYDDSESRIIVHNPSSNKFVAAYGEPISFRVSLFSSAGPVHRGDVYLYEANTNRRYQFQQTGDEYSLDYKVPWDMGSYLNLILYASFSVNNVYYRAVREINFDLLPDLKIGLAAPLKAGADGWSEVKLTVSYPWGEPVTEDPLNAVLGNTSLTLKKMEDLDVVFYAANVSLRRGEKAYLWVTDSSGNGGGIHLSPEEDADGSSGMDSRLLSVFAGLAVVAMFFLFVVRPELKKRRNRKALLQEYENIHQRIESLKKIRKNIMHEYYTRKITEQDARKRILDTEKELVMERGNMKAVLLKLGMDPKDMDGREEVIDWVTEKLKAGESIELIKKGLRDLNIDPLLAEKVRKTLS